MFSAMIFPDLIRSVALNLLLRMEEVSELDDASSAFHWLKFFEDNLGIRYLGEIVFLITMNQVLYRMRLNRLFRNSCRNNGEMEKLFWKDF